jgi:autotransporter-associated beta strand protein
LNVSGSGLLTLAGTGVKYNGNVNISGGTLQVYDTWTGGAQNGGMVQTGFSVGNGVANTITIGANGVLEMNVDTASVYQGDLGQVNGSLGNWGGTTITGNGVFLKVGNGTLGFENYYAPTTNFAMGVGGLIDIQDGELRNSAWNGVNWSNNYASMLIEPNGQFEFWNGNPVQIDALNGTGPMTCEQSNGQHWTMTLGVAGGSGTYSGHVSVAWADSFNMVKDGTGTQTLAGTGIWYGGSVTVNAGTLRYVDAVNFDRYDSPNDLGYSPTLTVNSAGTLEFNVSTNTGWSNDGSNESIGMYNESVTITGNGVLLKTGPGILGLGDQGGNIPVYFNMSGGTIDIEGGTLKNGGWANALWTPQFGANNLSSMTIGASGTLDLWDGRTVQIDALNGSGVVTNAPWNPASSLTIGANNGSGTFSGTILSGNITVTKVGTGIEVFSGTNTYTGGTTVTGGTLDFATPEATPSEGIVTVNSGGYVVLGALVGASSPAVEEEGAAGKVETTKTAADTSGTVVATTSTDSPTTATSLTTETVGGVAGVPVGGVGGAVGAAAVPEPGTLVLLLAGAAGLAVGAWKRRRLAR